MVRGLVVAGTVLFAAAAFAQEPPAGAPGPATQPLAQPVAQPPTHPATAVQPVPEAPQIMMAPIPGETVDLPQGAAREHVETAAAVKDEPFPWDSIGEGAFFIGVANILAGGIFIFLTKMTDDDYKSAITETDRLDAKDKNALFQNLAVGTMLAGAILVLGGGTAWALGGDEEKKKEISIRPVFSPDGLGLGLSGRF